MSTSRLFSAVLSLLALQGCSWGTQVGFLPIQEQVEQQLAAGETPLEPPTPGRIDVVVERQAGGLALRDGDDLEGDTDWVSVEAPPVDLDATPAEVKARLQPWLDELHARYGTTMVIFVPDYEEALAGALQHHLSHRFAEASVQVAHPGTQRRPGATVLSTSVRMRDDGIKRFELVLHAEDHTEVAAHGERRPRKHLAWRIPLAVLVFPLGALIGNSFMPAINRGAVLDSFSEAIDRLALAYADHLARCPASGCANRESAVATVAASSAL
jgi:hypothetical protein